MTIFNDLAQCLTSYLYSTPGKVSIIVLLLYPIIVQMLATMHRRAKLKASGYDPFAGDVFPFWLSYVPLPFLLIIANFQTLFFWLPKTDRGKTVMIRYILYKTSFGNIILSSDYSRKLYAYLFSPGSQLILVLAIVLGLIYLTHEWACGKFPKLRKYELDGYFFLYPALSVIFLFHICPVFYSLVLSMHRGTAQDIFKEFVFLEHYGKLLHDRTFWLSLKNTAWFAFGSVPLTIGFSLFIAMLLNRKIKGLSFYRTVYFLPVITSVAAISLVWRWVYHPQRGVLNSVLRAGGYSGLDWLYEPRGIFDMTSLWLFGARFSEAVRWLGMMILKPFIMVIGDLPSTIVWVFNDALPGVAEGPSLAITAVIIMSVWKGLGYNIIIFLAGLQNIPNELYEAARIDGAGIWSQFRNITWPLLSPTTYFVLIMSTISSFQVFAQIFMLYAGNATDGSRVVVYYLFEKGFQTFEFGYASALAYVLFLIIFMMTYVQRSFVGEKVHYD